MCLSGTVTAPDPVWLHNFGSIKSCFIKNCATFKNENVEFASFFFSFQALRVTMRKHPSSFKLNDPLKEKNDEITDKPVVLYDGESYCDCLQNLIPTRAVCNHHHLLQHVKDNLHEVHVLVLFWITIGRGVVQD